MAKKKIFISVTIIKDIGGISSSIVNLLNEIHSIYDVTLCVLTNYISPNITLPEKIKIINGSEYLKDIVVPRSLLTLQSPLRKILRNGRRLYNRFVLKNNRVEKSLRSIKVQGIYDVAIAFSDFVYNKTEKKCYDYFFIINCIKAKIKVAWIHSDAVKLGWNKLLAEKRLSPFTYIVNVSYDCKNTFDCIAPSLIEKSKVVYNLYNLGRIKTMSETYNPMSEDRSLIKFVTVSRIEETPKKIGRILDTVLRLKSEGYANFSWYLVGEGSKLEEYKVKSQEHKTNDIIHFVGLQPNPFPYVKNADAFVLCSEYEGFGMTIREAQILGIPTFVTNFGASNEVVNNGYQGEICENSTDGVYKMIKGVLDNPSKLIEYKRYLQNNPVDNQLGLNQFDSILS